MTAAVCRWMLECSAPPVQDVVVTSLGITVPACGDHAADHERWATDTRVLLNPSPEPEPECWCPDAHLDNGMSVEYCPTHGTPQERGLEL